MSCPPPDSGATATAATGPLIDSSFDLLRVPGLGRFLRWRGSRVALQAPLLAISLVMLGHALLGPQLAPKNLGALLGWVHFRGLVVLALLLVGNLFCMGCPFMLPREWARKWTAPRRVWPKALRNKVPAVVLFVAILFGYELFDFWASPWWTGMLIAGYFGAALAVDAFFRGASFCKYVCPIGQFNFLGSTLSPFEIGVRDSEVCESCTTHDCIRGVRRETGTPESEPEIVQRGCELSLFQPRKVGNLDCTFCLDCVYACPHDNVGMLARFPAEELGFSGNRSGVGRPERRLDFAVLSVVFAFGALVNALAMTSPAHVFMQGLAELAGIRVEWPILAALFALLLVLEPALLLIGAAALTRALTAAREPLLGLVLSFARSLVPIGFGLWLAHYGFHFFTGFLTVIPVTQNAVLRSVGWPLLGEPRWQLGGVPESVVFPIELGFLLLGLVGSWMVAWTIARDLDSERAGAGFAPWAVLHLLLFVSGVWVMTQPMEMRGTFLSA